MVTAPGLQPSDIEMGAMDEVAEAADQIVQALFDVQANMRPQTLGRAHPGPDADAEGEQDAQQDRGDLPTEDALEVLARPDRQDRPHPQDGDGAADSDAGATVPEGEGGNGTAITARECPFLRRVSSDVKMCFVRADGQWRCPVLCRCMSALVFFVGTLTLNFHPDSIVKGRILAVCAILLLCLFANMFARTLLMPTRRNRDAVSQRPDATYGWVELPFGKMTSWAEDAQNATYVRAEVSARRGHDAHLEFHRVAATEEQMVAVAQASAAKEHRKLCPFCLQEFCPADFVAVLPCSHVHCAACVESWIASCSQREKDVSCPYCRSSFTCGE